MIVDAVSFTTFEVAEDVQAVRLNLMDRDGRAIGVTLPLPCLTSLIMTLPAIQTQALRVAHADPSVRIVYPTERWMLERSEDPGCLLLTLMTPDGFQVCFSLHPDAVVEMARTVECPETAQSLSAANVH